MQIYTSPFAPPFLQLKYKRAGASGKECAERENRSTTFLTLAHHELRSISRACVRSLHLRRAAYLALIGPRGTTTTTTTTCRINVPPRRRRALFLLYGGSFYRHWRSRLRRANSRKDQVRERETESEGQGLLRKSEERRCIRIWSIVQRTVREYAYSIRRFKVLKICDEIFVVATQSAIINKSRARDRNKLDLKFSTTLKVAAVMNS